MEGKLLKNRPFILGLFLYQVLQQYSRKGPWKFGRNQILFDLGADENISMIELRGKLEDLDRLFDLVMVSERMEESLILLRHKLCWTLEDVIVFVKNARRNGEKEKLSTPTSNKVRDLNTADVILYNYFLTRHRENVYKFGEERMRREVSALRELSDEYYEHCVHTEVSGKDSRLEFKEYSAQVNGFILNNDTEEICRTLTMPELQFVNLVRKQQLKLLNRTKTFKPKNP